MKLTPTMVMTVIENVYGSGGNNGMTMMMMTMMMMMIMTMTIDNKEDKEQG